MAFQIPLLQRQANCQTRFRFSPSFPNPCRHRCFPPAGPLLWQAALLLFQIEEKRSCFYVYGHRLSGLNRFLSYRCDFPFPSADGFCRFGNDMFSFSGILLSVFGEIRLRSGWRACKKTSAYLSAFSDQYLSHRGIPLRLPDGFLRSDGGLYRKEFVMSTDFLFGQRAAEPFEFLIYIFSSFCLFLLFLPLR